MTDALGRLIDTARVERIIPVKPVTDAAGNVTATLSHEKSLVGFGEDQPVPLSELAAKHAGEVMGVDYGDQYPIEILGIATRDWIDSFKLLSPLLTDIRNRYEMSMSASDHASLLLDTGFSYHGILRTGMHAKRVLEKLIEGNASNPDHLSVLNNHISRIIKTMLDSSLSLRINMGSGKEGDALVFVSDAEIGAGVYLGRRYDVDVKVAQPHVIYGDTSLHSVLNFLPVNSNGWYRIPANKPFSATGGIKGFVVQGYPQHAISVQDGYEMLAMAQGCVLGEGKLARCDLRADQRVSFENGISSCRLFAGRISVDYLSFGSQNNTFRIASDEVPSAIAVFDGAIMAFAEGRSEGVRIGNNGAALVLPNTALSLRALSAANVAFVRAYTGCR